MFGSTALDVAVGLAFLYFILGAITSHVNELLAGLFGWRANYLEQGIRTLLQDPDLATKVWEHPLIRGIAGKPGRDPSYVPAQTFSLALFDALAPAARTGPTLAGVQSAITALPDSSAKQALQPMLADAQHSIGTARASVEDWYNAAMDRVTGVYKRQIQLVTLALSLFIAVGLGVDSVAIAQALWQEPALRAAVTGAAQGAAASVEDPLATLTQFDLPLGWTFLPQTVDSWLLKLAGLLITTAAISLGAPFWFDILKKLGNARSSGPAPGGRQ
jgi:hypothetical protein